MQLTFQLYSNCVSVPSTACRTAWDLNKKKSVKINILKKFNIVFSAST
jgi:hypothetical protein